LPLGVGRNRGCGEADVRQFSEGGSELGTAHTEAREAQKQRLSRFAGLFAGTCGKNVS